MNSNLKRPKNLPTLSRISPVLALSLMLASACKTNPKDVNTNYSTVLVPMTVVSPEPYLDRLPAALTGMLVLRGNGSSQIARPLYRTRIALYKIDGELERLITEFNSDEAGAFKITRPVEKGIYELRVADPRYEGILRISLTEKPARDLLLEVGTRGKAFEVTGGAAEMPAATPLK